MLIFPNFPAGFYHEESFSLKRISCAIHTKYSMKGVFLKKKNSKKYGLYSFHIGPESPGRNHPTMDVTNQTTTAINRDLSQPMV